MKYKKTKEFSKKIFNIVITLFIIVIIYSMALMWKTNDTTALCYLIPSVGGLEQLGCNHTVPTTKEKIQKHLNQKAHE